MVDASGRTIGWVYFIGGEKTGLVKIGWTEGHPAERLKKLQAASPVRLLPMALEPGFLGLEHDLHRRFDAQRAHGEWFELTEELLEYMAERARGWLRDGEKPEPDVDLQLKDRYLAERYALQE